MPVTNAGHDASEFGAASIGLERSRLEWRGIILLDDDGTAARMALSRLVAEVQGKACRNSPGLFSGILVQDAAVVQIERCTIESFASRGAFFNTDHAALEERSPPSVLIRANELAAARRQATDPISHLADNPALLASRHASCPGAAAPGAFDVLLAVANAKINEVEDRREAIGMLDPKETIAVLANGDALARLLAKPDGTSRAATDRHPPQRIGT